MHNQPHCELITHALNDGRSFGVSLIRSTKPDGTHEPHAVGTYAQIAGYARLADGRFLLELEGIRRFRISSTRCTGPFPTAAIEWLPEQIGNFAAARSASDEAEHLFYAYRARHGDADLPVRVPVDPIARSYVITTHLKASIAIKQSLLEAPTAADRLEAIVGLLSRSWDDDQQQTEELT